MSRWANFFNRPGIAALFHSISLGLVFLPEETFRSLKPLIGMSKEISEIEESVGADIVEALMNEGILVTDDFDDFGYLEEARQKLLKEITLELMYLLVTDHCNLRCGYCFEDSPVLIEPFNPVHMSVEIARDALDLFARMVARYGDPKKKKVIHLYGGEPLMNGGVVRFAVDYICGLKTRGILPSVCETAIVTNGTFLDDEMARFFSEKGVTVGVSIDGPHEMNNLYRKTKDGELDVFAAIMRALGLLKKYKAKVGLSVTLTSEAVQHFDKLLAFLTDEVGWVDGISLNILHFNPNIFLPPNYYSDAVRCQIAAFEKFRELGMYEDRMMRKAGAFINRQPIYADCGVIGNQLVIAPDGQIGVCQDFVKPRTYFRGSVIDKDSDPVAAGLFKEWERRSPFFMKDCLDCPAMGICGGGCPASAELKTGSRWNLDERACAHGKMTIEWLIWETYAQLIT
ncbi:hypothetical protein A3K33_02165 [Candidatus Azambacteria bacterium RIFOXYC1_FULL_41_20]|nr:MAG: hypothetical protein A3K28_02175 [Candidatus Azambacteria bacterium RIFOXYB1_FULL_40_33]OGD41560.1 MAG: hypothetical protein A3I82_02285 [Candidatus Azambacteria bacterium RIFCSPLOWO2_02_FULL_42_10]OGD42700.1 MAG: hypothetical protein A2193_02180 [Candidatus Azambacteria bacterium RIFOXYA1_FULL_42_37]OGD43812.1 MAG: hypothetical protein A3K33_02165 [Candidatus Azambacteria bacterium RIFOXYC1_FULL_41_20]OGD47605.1 MAG: hypothetical protein A3K35_02165 [Candidatus Azambacteria bacterium R